MRIEVSEFDSEHLANFDAFICSIGYETRSTYIMGEVAGCSEVILGHVFSQPETEVLQKNKLAFEAIGGKPLGERGLHEALADHFKDRKPKSVAIDVSSMTRTVMADLFSQLIDDPYFSGISVTVLYALAQFSPPPSAPANLIDFSPIYQFSGWTTQPEKPAVMILGLGYELDQAIGAIEYIDPSATVIFSPIGKDVRFEVSVADANKPLFDIVSQLRQIKYDVDDPLETYWYLHSLVGTFVNDARVVVVPMGPKIFVSLCLLCQRDLGDEVSVWRASSHSDEAARDVIPEGTIIGYTFNRVEETGRS